MHRPSPAQTPDANASQQMGQPMQVFQMMPVSQSAPAAPLPGTAAAPPPRPPSPKFVGVDLPTPKLAHSDVYLRY